MNGFEISHARNGLLLRWNDSASLVANRQLSRSRWLRRPKDIEVLIACERQTNALIQRSQGREILHCSAARSGAGTLLLCGESGRGKSTLSAALRLKGRPLLADDEVFVSLHEAELAVSAIYEGSRLNAESLALLNVDGAGCKEEFPGSNKVVWTGGDANPGVRHSISAVVILETARPETQSSDFARITGTEAFSKLIAQLKFPWMCLPEWRPRQFNLISRLVREVPIFRWRRHLPAKSPAEWVEELLHLCETSAAKTTTPPDSSSF